MGTHTYQEVLTALYKSRKHWQDNAVLARKGEEISTIASYCALCQLFGCDSDACRNECPLQDSPNEKRKACANEYWSVGEAKKNGRDLTAPIAAMLARIDKEIVKWKKNAPKKVSEKTPKSAHRKGELFDGFCTGYTQSKIPANHHLEFAGELKKDEDDTFFLNHGTVWYGKGYVGHEKLIAVPDKTKSKPKEPRVTVTYWGRRKPGEKKSKKSSYHFCGLPDVDRIIRETGLLKDGGAWVVRVKSGRIFAARSWHRGHAIWIWRTSLGDGGYPTDLPSGLYGCFESIKDAGYILTILNALRTLPPVEPEFHVGDLVWWDGDRVTIEDVGDTLLGVRMPNGRYESPSKGAVRHLTPAEWVNTVTTPDGKEIRARLYWTGDGNIRIVYEGGDWNTITSKWLIETIKSAGNVIMPCMMAVDRYGAGGYNWPRPEES